MVNFDENRNFYLASVGYINAAQILADSMQEKRLFDDSHELKTIQLWPLYHILSLCGEFVLKTCLTINGNNSSLWIKNKKGHDLEFLLEEFEKNFENLDALLRLDLIALNKGEYRYFKFFGGVAVLNLINHNDYLNALRNLSDRYQSKFLGVKSEVI